MTQGLPQPGFITDAVNAARLALIVALAEPSEKHTENYKAALKDMAESMDITEQAALKILTGDL